MTEIPGKRPEYDDHDRKNYLNDRIIQRYDWNISPNDRNNKTITENITQTTGFSKGELQAKEKSELNQFGF